jgi:hypothetical protein
MDKTFILLAGYDWFEPGESFETAKRRGCNGMLDGG